MKPFTEKRPWGDFRQFTKNEKSTVKILTIKPGHEFSLQYHKYRKEFWKILSGNPKIIIGKKSRKTKNGEEFAVPAKKQHRVRAGKETAKILEISFGNFNEKDIVRLKDRYGRA